MKMKMKNKNYFILFIELIQSSIALKLFYVIEVR